ncbi:hypothetical protein MMYC01_204970 [Madurella mycetomatis]|uniref:Uncharacterized protein n=1 Tax=Madurella mycetomatis TaxID=100816 RepID=A0A175W4M8_9PEZI|nr:hypothetical protein MMYC01_204970 [Madurella mycetomatis]
MPRNAARTANPTPTTITTTTTLLISLLLLLALFPNLFHFFWTLPLHLFTFLTPASKRSSSSSLSSQSSTMWTQKQFTLPARARGSYLITDTVLKEVPEIGSYKVGLLNLFIQHTSCALSLNENWDPDVRADMSDTLDRIVPEAGPKGEALYRHDAEGPDDLPAHVKSALIGASVTIPIRDGKLATGTWQGIWYLEFRAAKHSRRIVATIQGEKA